MSNEQVTAVLAQSLDLGYSDIERIHPDWTKEAVDDYFYKQSNINSIAALSDDQTDQIDENTETIQNHINETTDAHDASAIGYDNSSSGLSAENAQGAIDEVDGNLDSHISSESAHGVTGDNVGTEDFAQPLIGGVVLQAANVADAIESTVSVTSPDAPAAAVAYSQADTQVTVNLVNEMKGDINQLVSDLNNSITQLNALLTAMQDAGQMVP